MSFIPKARNKQIGAKQHKRKKAAKLPHGLKRIPAKDGYPEEILSICPECGYEQADMGNHVSCEECDYSPMPTADQGDV